MGSAALAALLVASLLPPSAADGTTVTDRAACPYRQHVRTFGDGPDQFNMTVADRELFESSSCRGGFQCRPLIKTVSFCQGGSLMEREVPMAWVCAAEGSGVPAAREPSLRARRSSGPRPRVIGLVRCRREQERQQGLLRLWEIFDSTVY